MAVSAEYRAFVLEQLGRAVPVTSRSMFGAVGPAEEAVTRAGSAAAAAAIAIAGMLTGCAVVAAPRTGEGDVVAINGTRLFVHREGRGEPAIIVHGGPVLDHG